jgi:hypothetical protein
VLLLVDVVVVGIVGGQLEAADRAGAVEVEPREDAVPVEDVFAGELLGGGAEVEVVHADGARRQRRRAATAAAAAIAATATRAAAAATAAAAPMICSPSRTAGAYYL